METIPNININLLNIDFEIPNHNKSFLSIFTFLRKKLQIKSSRKNHIDSLLKKSKGKFFKAVFEGIKICLNLRIKKGLSCRALARKSNVSHTAISDIESGLVNPSIMTIYKRMPIELL